MIKPQIPASKEEDLNCELNTSQNIKTKSDENFTLKSRETTSALNENDGSEDIKTQESELAKNIAKKTANERDSDENSMNSEENSKSSSEESEGSEEEDDELKDFHSNLNMIIKSEEDVDNSQKFQTCNICSSQLVPLNNRSHAYTHARSKFVSNLMRKFYRKAPDETKIFCTACSTERPRKKKRRAQHQLLYHGSGFKHLCDYHRGEFRGHEKEVLKALNFFLMVKRNDPKFDEIVEEFPFSYKEMLYFIRVYFSTSNENRNKKKLLLGRMYTELKDIIIAAGLKPSIKNQTKMLMDAYLEERKGQIEPKKRDRKSRRNRTSKSRERKPKKVKKVEKSSQSENSDDDDEDEDEKIKYEFIKNSNKRLLKENHEYDMPHKNLKIEERSLSDENESMDLEDLNNEDEDTNKFMPDNVSEVSCTLSHIPIQIKLAQTEKTLGSVYQQLTRERIKFEYAKAEYEKKIARLKQENAQIKGRCLELEAELKKAVNIIDILRAKSK